MFTRITSALTVSVSFISLSLWSSSRRGSRRSRCRSPWRASRPGGARDGEAESGSPRMRGQRRGAGSRTGGCWRAVFMRSAPAATGPVIAAAAAEVEDANRRWPRGRSRRSTIQSRSPMPEPPPALGLRVTRCGRRPPGRRAAARRRLRSRRGCGRRLFPRAGSAARLPRRPWCRTVARFGARDGTVGAGLVGRVTGGVAAAVGARGATGLPPPVPGPAPRCRRRWASGRIGR